MAVLPKVPIHAPLKELADGARVRLWIPGGEVRGVVRQNLTACHWIAIERDDRPPGALMCIRYDRIHAFEVCDV